MRRLGLVILAAIWSGCGPPERAATLPEVADGHTPLALSQTHQSGRVIYETLCWTCHGLAGRGDGPAVASGSVPSPPSLLSEEYAEASASSLQRRFQAGMDGVDPDHPHMQYVASLLRPESFGAALSFIPVLAYPAELPGSTLAGEALYRRRCVGCHGEAGRGDGTASSSLVLMRPADFTTDTLLAARDWHGVFARIREGGRHVQGSSMPPWGMVLNDAEIWDLVSYVATFQPGLLHDPPWIDD